jgi:hypothetical protein
VARSVPSPLLRQARVGEGARSVHAQDGETRIWRSESHERAPACNLKCDSEHSESGLRAPTLGAAGHLPIPCRQAAGSPVWTRTNSDASALRGGGGRLRVRLGAPAPRLGFQVGPLAA